MSKKREDIAVIVLAAGQGTRMKSNLPKVLHRLAGVPLIQHVIYSSAKLNPTKQVIVVGHGADEVAAAVDPLPTVLQKKQQGTGDAVKVCLPELKDFSGEVFVLFGDTPLITEETLRAMLEQRRKTDAAVVVLGFTPYDPGHYGRLVVHGATLKKIVEYADATPKERGISLCNSGVMVFDGKRLPELLNEITNENARSEYYLTDAIEIAVRKGYICQVVEADADELLGVNSRVELAQAEQLVQARLRRQAMENGVTMIDPDTVYFSIDTQLEEDIVIEPNVFFRSGVRVETGCVIRANSYLEGVTIKKGATVGPFARLRPDTVIEAGARIGNFVEVKKSTIGKGAKVSHLSYIGDSDVGAEANIGAGTITCNYDGENKYQTNIGAGAFIGSNTALVAPVKVGKNAMVGAGSVIVDDVPDGSLAVARGSQSNFKDRKSYRESISKK